MCVVGHGRVHAPDVWAVSALGAPGVLERVSSESAIFWIAGDSRKLQKAGPGVPMEIATSDG
jgi:hypothetical protein